MNQPLVSVIKLSGELEIGRKAAIAAALQFSGSEKSVLVDLSAVTFADSTALGELIRFRGEADTKNVPVAILIGSRQVARLFQYAGLGRAFAIFDDRGAALAYLGEIVR